MVGFRLLGPSRTHGSSSVDHASREEWQRVTTAERRLTLAGQDRQRDGFSASRDDYGSPVVSQIQRLERRAYHFS